MPDSKKSSPSLPSWVGTTATRLRKLRGWRRAGAAFGFGCLGALAFSPLNLTPILWLSFPALLLCLQTTESWRGAFAVAWSFAFGFFLVGLYWIADSMFVDIKDFWWAVPFAVAGLPAVLAIYYGLIAIAARKIGFKGFSGAVSFALLWFLADYARGHFFTGFPWNLEGYAWSGVLPMLQITSIIGIYGLTLITLVAACLPAILVNNNRQNRAIVIFSIALLVLMDFWGQARLAMATTTMVPNMRLRLVQPSVPQEEKWLQSEREINFARLLYLSSQPGEQPITHIIWPETAATFYLAEDDDHRMAVASHVPPGGSILTGVVSRTIDTKGKMHYYNSLVAIDGRARIVAGYDKHHLVPYGEYIPFRSVLPIRALVGVGVDFSSGDGPKTLRVKGLPPFSPFICYEAIFPGEVAPRQDRPGFLLNITNDGWYGRTAGPYQHFAIARVRAVEEGLPIVRAANTGISGVVDAYGRIVARLGLAKTGFIDTDLPTPLPPTIFARAGDIPLWSLYGALMVAIVCVRYRPKK